jgi:SAM-dependent methyltransferase
MPIAQRSRLATTQDDWNKEFADLQVIPTSTRTTPSRALLLFEPFFGRGRPLRILDAGAGIGRNALYLAQRGHSIVAFDFAQQALARLREASAEAGLDHRISVVSGSLEHEFPFDDASFDLVLDSYVSCHFLDADLREHFVSEIGRVLGDRGQLFSTQFSTEDEYYRALITNLHAVDPIVVDPRNGIAKQLYARTTAQTIFATLGDLPYFAQFDFTDFVIERNYRRSVFALLLEK